MDRHESPVATAIPEVNGARQNQVTQGAVAVGEAFVRALASRDRPRLVELLREDVDFQALTPGRHWVATNSIDAVDDIMLGRWLGPQDVVLDVLRLTSDAVIGRQSVSYRLAVRRDGRDHVLEQHAYYVADAGRISWIRVLCSGYQAVEPAPMPT